MTNHTEEASRPFIVCPTCEGNGTHGPGHVYTQDDLDERFGYEQDAVMADYRAGVYDVTCTECAGRRVVRDECPCDDCEGDRLDLADMYAEMAAERRVGC